MLIAGLRSARLDSLALDTASHFSFAGDHELSILALHLLQNCMAYINTLMMQQILARPHWASD